MPSVWVVVVRPSALDAVALATSSGPAVTETTPGTGWLAVSLALLGVVALAVQGGPENPIRQLTEKVRRVQETDGDVEFAIDRDDAIGDLYAAVGDLVETYRERDREAAANDRYRKRMHEITADADLSDEEKVGRLLDLGRERLGVENAHVVRIDEAADRHEVVVASGSDLVTVGTVSDPSETFCRRTIAADDDVLGVSDAVEDGYGNDPAYRRWGISRYIGAKILVDDDLYGTVCFVDESARDRPFTRVEKVFVDLVSRWISHVFERGERTAELERNERVLDAAPVGVTVTDATREDDPIVEVNGAFEEISGYDESECLGRNYLFLQGPDTDPERVAQLREAVEAEERTAVELRNYRKDGTPFWNRVSVAPVRDGGEVTHFVGFHEDVTDRKEKEGQLRERERDLRETNERLNAIIEASPDAIVALDLDGNVQRWNPAAERIFGWRESEVLGEPPAFVPEDRTEEFARFVARLRDGETVTGVEVERRTRDGSAVAVSLSAAPIRDGDGAVEGIMGVLEDISERKARERELTRLISNVPGFVYRSRNEPTWLTEFASAGVRDVTGYDPAELESGAVNWGEDVMVARDEATWEKVQRAVAERRAFTNTYQIETADGERRWVQEQGRGVYADDGSLETLEGVVIDVTERVEYQRELERTQHLLEQSQRLAGVGAWELDVEDGGEPTLTMTDEALCIHDLPLDADLDLAEAVDYYHPDDRERIRDGIERALERGEGYDIEARLVTAAGDERWVRSIADPVREDGEVVAVRGSIQDVTAQKRRERDLRDAKERIQKVIEASPAGVLATDTAGNVTLWNDGMEEIFGWAEAEVLGEPFPATPDDGNGADDEVRERVQSGERIRQVERQRVTKDGRRIDVSLSTAPIRNESGEVTEVVAFIQDVTGRKRREAELERTKDLLQQAGRIAGFGGWELDVTTDPPAMTWTEELYDIHGLERDTEIDVETTVQHYHPDDRAFVEDRFRTAIETGQGYDMEVRALRGDGEVRWVRALCETVTEDGEVVRLRGSIQDITDQKEREFALQSIHEATRKLLTTEETADAADLVVEAAESVLDVSAVCIYLYDDERNVLERTAASEAFDDYRAGDAAAAGPETESVLWDAFVTESLTVIEDPGSMGAERPFVGAVEHGLAVPIGTHGVFVAVDEAGRIDEPTRRLTETLVATTAAALDRIESEARLRERDEQLAAQNERLRRQIRINETIRSVAQSLVGATSQATLEADVCERLADGDEVAFAWIGGVDGGDRVVPRAWAGEDRGYLDAATLDRTIATPEPAVRTVEIGEPTVVPNVAHDVQREAWRREALAADFQSVLAVPLAFDEYSYGVLAVYATEPRAFGDLEEKVFAELGGSIANAITSVSTKRALHEDMLVSLRLRIEVACDPLTTLARRANCTVTYEGHASHAPDEIMLFVRTDGADAGTVAAALADQHAVRDGRHVTGSGDGDVFEVTVGGSSLVGRLVRHGGRPRSIVADADGMDVEVEVPVATDVRSFVEMLDQEYDVELVGRREVSRSRKSTQGIVDQLLDRLTDRQREVLRTAYFAGFFNWPRDTTGEELAEMLDVSQPTINRHLRLGEGRIMQQLFDADVGD